MSVPKFAQFQEYVYNLHRGQKRKFTEEPYFAHCVRVCKTVSKYYANEAVLCVAMGHDLIEDTPATLQDIVRMCASIGFNDDECILIGKSIQALTQDHTLSRNDRLPAYIRQMEIASRVYPLIIDVKYADIIDNCSNIDEVAPIEWAKKYLEEKIDILKTLNAGRSLLHQEALNLCTTKLNLLCKN